MRSKENLQPLKREFVSANYKDCLIGEYSEQERKRTKRHKQREPIRDIRI